MQSGKSIYKDVINGNWLLKNMVMADVTYVGFTGFANEFDGR